MYKNVVIALFLISSTVIAAEVSKNVESRQIVVVGSATQQVKPTTASWSGSFKIVTAKPEHITAQMEQARQTVIKFLEDHQLEPAAVQFQPAQVTPLYDNKANKIDQYEANQVFSVHGDDIDKITKLAHESFNLFSKEIQFRPDSVQYDIKNPTVIDQELLVEALKNARDKAKTLADVDGGKVGAPVKIEEVNASTPRPAYGMMMRASISPSDTDGVFKTRSINIQVTFAVEG